MTKEMEDLLCGEAEGDGTIQPGREKVHGNLILVSKCLMGGNDEEGAGFSSVVPAGWMRSNGTH